MRWPAITLAIGAACTSHEAPTESSLVDLGGGDSPRAWQIVFVGDGYRADELPAYRAQVDAYVAALIAHDDGFVTLAPEAFHFYRGDVSGEGWYLGTFLDRSGSCDLPLILGDDALARRAAVHDAVPDPDVIVVVANDVEGRANAGAITHVSSRDGWQVLEHELSHALFHLGDEYTEFKWCSSRAPQVEAELLAVANVTLLPDTAKWGGTNNIVLPGGDRWPCAFHPTSSCTMLDANAAHYCPVCAAATHETIAARLCNADSRAPRVALVETQSSTEYVSWSGQTMTIEAAAFDEGDVKRFRFLVDDVAFAESELPWAELALDTLAHGYHVLTAQAIDEAGHVGTSAPRSLVILHTAELAPGIGQLAATAYLDGWVQVSMQATPPGGSVTLALGAQTTVVPIDRVQPLVVWLPADTPGVTTLTATAHTSAGVASALSRIDVNVPSPSSAPPEVEAVHVGSVPLSALAAVGKTLDTHVTINSCAALARVEVVGADGSLIGSTAVEPQHGCVHSVYVPIAPIAGTMSITAIDRRARKGALAVTMPPVRDAALLGIEATVDDPVVALGRPATIALGGPGATIVNSSAYADGMIAVPSPMTRADGSRGLLLAARDIIGPLRDGGPASLRVTIVGNHSGLVAATTVIPVTVDAIAPRLRVSRFRRDGDALTIDASDRSGPVTVETAGNIIRAFDAAGNVAQRTIVPVTFPHDRQGCTP